MKQLRISSAFNLNYRTSADTSEHIRESLTFYKEMGFDAIDFSTGLLNLSDDSWKDVADRALEDSNKAGIHFEMSHLPYLPGGGIKDEDFLRLFDIRMINAIDAVARLKIKYAVLHPNAVTMPLVKFDRKQQYDLVMKHLAPYAEHAAKVGVNLAIENMRVIHGMRHSHRYCQTPDELCDVADALGIDVCWDFGHANISGLKQSEALAYVGKRLKVIHVNDNTGGDDDHVPPFVGSVDWKDAMHGLALAGYDGLFNYELSVGNIPQSAREAFAKYLIAAAKELTSYVK